MSVTFWAPAAPTEQFQPYPDQDFVDERSVLPELNVANATAASLLRILNLPVDASGTVRCGEEMARVLQRILVLTNSEAERLPGIVPGFVTPKVPSLSVIDAEGTSRVVREGHARVVSMGICDERLTRHLEVLQRLFVAAQREDYDVVWG